MILEATAGAVDFTNYELRVTLLTMTTRITRFDFATLGENMLRLSPPDHQRIAQATTLDMKMGGAESNVAIALARLGYQTTWLSRLPDNPLGQRMVSELNAHNVDTSGVRMVPNERLGTYYIEFGAPPRPNRVIYDRANSATSRMRIEDVAFDLIEAASWFHATGITPALSPSCLEMTAATLAFARQKGITTSFDLNYRALLWTPAQAGVALAPILADCDYLFGAHRDAIALFKVSENDEEAATQLQSRFGCRCVVVTIGESGAIARTATETVRMPQTFEVPHPVDRIGAGDAFDAGFIASQMQGKSIADSLKYGNATSALKMTIPGDHALISAAEIDQLIGGEKRASVR